MSLRQEKKRKAREEILAAASRLILEQGYEPARMRDIAMAAGISYQTLYNYFPTKARILEALLLRDVEHLVQDIERIIRAYAGNVLATLDQMNRLCLAALDAGDRGLWRRATVELLQENPAATGAFTVIEMNTLDSLQLLLRRAQEFGELRGDAPVSMLAETLFALADYNLLRYLMQPETTAEGALEHLTGQLRLLLEPHLQPAPEAFVSTWSDG